MKISLLKQYLRLSLFLLYFTTVHETIAQDSIVCHALLKKGVDDMMNVRYASALENLSKSKALAQSAKLSNPLFLATNNLGLTYFKMMDYGQALTYYLEAYELAIAQKNPVNEMTVLNNIAIVYIKEKKLEQAESYFLKSFAIAKEQKLDTRIGYYATNLAQLNLEMNNLAKATTYIATAVPKLQSEPRILMSALLVQNAILLEKGFSKEVLKNGLPLLEKAQKSNFAEEQTELLLLIAKAYFKDRQFDKAMHYVERGLSSTQHHEVKIQLFELHSQIAFQLQLLEKSLASKDSIIQLTQLLSDTKNSELLENTTLRFELSESKYALAISKAQSENQRKVYLLSIILLFLLLFILLVVFYKRNQLTKQKRIIEANTLQIKHLELEKEKNQRKLLEHEVELKNKMISDKVLFQSTRNELIESLIQTITRATNFTSDVTLLQSVKELKSHLKEDVKWEDFTAHFEHVNTDFIHALKLKHPDLNANDIRFLSFIYLNISLKEIASLLHISPESCRKRKERLIKKLGIGITTPLYTYLTQVAKTK
ncbi:tetratricopeptide repeat protein [Flavobacterium sp. UBA6135]|uniref:tetratricopeptide repeat protein n=1 Tax=Flavobacterium sp. UBA6135 TaxID=1946553 RepID=UPI0025B8B230|nr:tetratricopeptide repeat protein [Flavobacterium sp. UBA6135]